MISSIITDKHGHSPDVNEHERLLVQLPGPFPNVPETANSQTHSFETFVIGNKGQSNIFIYRPVFQNENVADSANAVITLSGSATSYGMQLFRASSTNINTVAVATKATAVTTLKDAFTAVGTGNDVWNTSQSSKLTLSLDTASGNYNNTSVDTNSQSLKFTWGSNPAAVNANKPLTSSQNWSSVQTFSIWFKANQLQTLYFILSDGTNSSTWNFSNTTVNIFEQKIFNIAEPSSTSGILNVAAITKFEIGAVTVPSGSLSWVDSFESQVAPGNLYVQLWDFGTNIYPLNLSQGTQLILDDGSNQVQISNPVIKTYQRIQLKYGVSDSTKALKYGNYYGLVFYNGGSGTAEIWGNSTEKIYTHGNVFTSPNSGGVLTDIPNSSLFFTIFSYKECYIRRFYISMDDVPGQAKTITLVYSIPEKRRVATLLNNFRFHNKQYLEFDYTDLPIKINSDDYIVINYVDDINSAITEIQFGIDAVYEDFVLWGGGRITSN